MSRYIAGALAVVLLGFIFSAWAFNMLPERIAIHWNAQGNADGFGGRGFAFAMPLLSLFFVLLLSFVPNIDPRKEHIEQFRDTYDQFILMFAGFMAYINILTVAANLGWTGSITAYMAPALGVLLYYAGNLMERSRSSWFIGIRTPWTLSSEKVWDKTNKLGGRTLKWLALVMVIGMILVPETFLAMILLIAAWAIGTIAYSYFAWKQETARQSF